MAATGSQSTVPAQETKAQVTGNESGKTASLTGGFVQIMYYESILQDSIKVDYIFADAGNSVDKKSVMEGLPLVGTEDFELEFEDNQEVKLEFNAGNKNTLIVNKITPQVAGDAGKEIVTLNLVSEEFIRNEEGASRINVRMDGPISDHIESILKNFLITEKELHIEETINNFNFVGNNKKPYYTMNWLSKFGIPSGGEGSVSGYFFWETSEGFHFKSIDSLFSKQENPLKKKFIFTATDDSQGIPEGFDGKILELLEDNRIDFQNKIMMGAFGTKLVVFNPFDCFYEAISQTAEDAPPLDVGGDALPIFNKKFDNPSAEENFTRTTFMYIDTGTLPSGDNKEQIDKNEKPNFESQLVLNQGIRRYNQFFSQQMTITIGGDFSLHAGDAIFVDVPSVKSETDDERNDKSGGRYVIADLCHYVSTKETYTKMNLVRDSFGRVAEN